MINARNIIIILTEAPGAIKFIFRIDVLITIAITFTLTAFITFTYTKIYIENRIIGETKNNITSSFGRIFDEVLHWIVRALYAVGGEQVPAAERIYSALSERLGPIFAVQKAFGPDFEALGRAIKGTVKQELFCTGGECGRRAECGGSMISSGPTINVHATATTATAASPIGPEVSNTIRKGDRLPYPYCDCGLGEWRTAGSAGLRIQTREVRLDSKAHATEARQAIEAIKQRWNKLEVFAKLGDAHRALTEAASLSPEAGKSLAAKAEQNKH